MSHYRCPRCGDDDHLYIGVRIDVRLRQSDDNFETEYEGGDHEWDDMSPAWCGACRWDGVVGATKEN